jgi:hypothetical protein
VAPIDDDGSLDVAAFESLLGPRTKIVSVAHVSNALGTINPVAELTAKAHAVGAVVLVDGAQAVPHMRVDVQALDCDFYAFSGHKMFGPTGVGVLYGKRALLDGMPPYQGGGDMILTVTFERSTYNSLPYKFEAGTPNITGVVGLGAAVDGLENWQALQAELHEIVQKEDWRLAVAKAAEAIAAFPDYVDGGSPYIAKARAHRELGETALGTDTLREYRRRRGNDPDALLALPRPLDEATPHDEAIEVFGDLVMVAPLRPEVHLEYGDSLAAAGRNAQALVEYQALLAMKPQDLADAHYRLAKTYVALEDRAKGREHLLYALEIAPHYREAQQLLLEVVR